jgi:hypothetical protein
VTKPRLFLCSGATIAHARQSWRNSEVVRLNALGNSPNVNIRIEDVARAFAEQIPPRLLDLLEIAAYVYSADTAARRSTLWEGDGSVEPWARQLRFAIPVRDLEFWKRSTVQVLLKEVLNFLSNDNYDFKFLELTARWQAQDYLDFGSEEDWQFYHPDRVVMFSGGLDSLAGATETLSKGENTVLVSHRPVGSIDSRQKRLVATLRSRFPNQLIHIPICINKNKNLGREHTQRTRSFLYSAIGCVVASAVKARGVRFFENGIVSLNLPVADEVLQARASRTTHPIAVEQLGKFYSLVLERDLVIDNPYIYQTKTEIVSNLMHINQSDLIGLSCSCAHTWFKTRSQWHCGRCSQCIDRRIAILAAGAVAHELAEDYVEDVFTGKRSEHYERNMAVDYVRHALELSKMGEQEIASKFNLELGRAARPFGNRRQTVEKFIAMHSRHGNSVKSVIESQLAEHAADILEGALEQSSMLAMIFGQQHQEPNWQRFCQRIVNLLSKGLPVVVRTHKPKDEPHLQELCDGILKAQDLDLDREFPFMRWSSSLTKPDWSSESHNLWIELKYARKQYGLRKITEDIAADITKYGDNVRHTLFLIYDPDHLVTDEEAFAAPIHARATMRSAFIR